MVSSMHTVVPCLSRRTTPKLLCQKEQTADTTFGRKSVAMMFYIGFLAVEFPTQYLAQHISRLGKYLGANVMLWGVILSCMAATTSYAGLMICRTLLGIFEAPVAPILVLIIAMWYKKGEQGRRVVS